MRFSFIFIASLSFWVLPVPAWAEIPKPVRSNAVMLGAENVILCSDFEQLNAARVSLFLRELGEDVAFPTILDGPMALSKSRKFNVLYVISGLDVQYNARECAIATVPYGVEIIDEINTTVQKLLDGFTHPSQTINAMLGETSWVSSNYYHESGNWITVVIAMRTPSLDQLNDTMIKLFDQPKTACEQNLACLTQ